MSIDIHRVILLAFVSLLGIGFMLVLRQAVGRSTVPQPSHAWLLGQFYFLYLPLSAISFAGQFAIEAFETSSLWGRVDMRNPDDFNAAMLVLVALTINLVVFALIYASQPRRQPVQIVSDSWQAGIRRLLWLLGGALFCAWSAQIVASGGLAEFLAAHWYTRHDEFFERYGALFVLFVRVTDAMHLAFAAAAGVYIYGCLQTRRYGWVMLAFVACILLAGMILTGNRIFIAILGIFSIWCLALVGRRLLLLGVFLAAPVAAWIFSLWATVRGDLPNILENIQASWAEPFGKEVHFARIVFDLTEGINVMVLLQLVKDYVSGSFELLLGETYAKLFVFFVPAALMPDKPRGLTTTLAEVFEPGEATSLPATSFGEMFANFGWLALVMLPVVTWLISRLDGVSIGRFNIKPVHASVLFLAVLWGSRSTFYDNTLAAVFGLLIVGVALKVSGVKRGFA